MRNLKLAGLLVLPIALSLPLGVTSGTEIIVLEKPDCVFPGQLFRVVLKQPAGQGKIDVNVPPTVEMFDTWPQDTIQRFYFRALNSGDATLIFHAAAGSLTIPIEVTPWSDILAPRKVANTVLPRIWPLGETEFNHVKQRETFHGDEELQGGRDPRAKVTGLAAHWVDARDEEIWNIIPGPSVARTCLIVLSGGGREDGRGKGCPVCGMKVYEGRSGFYPWIFDQQKHPWKVGCPSCKTWFPSNDWHQGDMHSGDFPDDGFGCEPVTPILAPNGKPWRWPFIAYYHQWTAYMKTFTPGIEQSAQAYARTGDRRYAHKAAVGLFRFAECMLDMSVNLNHRKMAYRDAILRGPAGTPDDRSGRIAGSFLYIQPNWDTPRMETCARAWDLIFDTIDGDEQLIAFCRSQHHPEIKTARDFRRFVEAGVIRVPLQAALDNAVARNYPMQETLVATLALVLDSPRCLDLVDWLLHDGAGIRFTLANDYFKDGSACESESYNHIHIADMERLFDLLARIRTCYPQEWERRGFVSMYDDPKYRMMYDFPIDNGLIGRTITATGDVGWNVSSQPRGFRQTFPTVPGEYANVYQRTRDPRFAQVLFGPDGIMPSTIDSPDLRGEVESIGTERGWQVDLTSDLLDGYGHAILRSGKGEHRRAFWLRYGRVKQHAHADLLTMGLAALRRDWLSELGYPQGWTHTGHWAANWGTHYGTHITGVPTRQFGRGAVTLFAATPPAQVATAVASAVSGNQNVSRSRTIVLVDLSDKDCYAVTLERVEGGRNHTLSFHGPEGPATPTGLKLMPQTGGTVAGADTVYGDYAAIQTIDPELSCLAFMYDVQRTEPSGVWSISFPLKDQQDACLHMTMVQSDGGELALAKGKPPQGQQSYELNWAILQREGTAPLHSQFLSVLEPCEGDRLVRKIERVGLSHNAGGSFQPLGVRIISHEFVDTLIFQTEVAVECATTDGLVCDAEFGFWRECDGKVVKAVFAGGNTLKKHNLANIAVPGYQGRITKCDWNNRTVTLEPAPEQVDTLVGQHIRITNPSGNEVSCLIKAATIVDGQCTITLPFDPRIGEGFVDQIAAGTIRSSVKLRFASYWDYYAGKTITNEDATVHYRLRDVSQAVNCVLDEAANGKVEPSDLRSAFTDVDGDGRPRYVIYDYGPGDEATIKVVGKSP